MSGTLHSIPLVLDTAKSYIFIFTYINTLFKILKFCIWFNFVGEKYLRENLRTGYKRRRPKFQIWNFYP